MIPWNPDSESRINYGTYLGQFGLVMVFVHCLVFNEIVHNISTGKLSIPESAIVKKSHHKSNTAVCRVAGLGRLSAGASMALKPFVKRVITIFATNASFLRAISNFRI